MSENPEHAAAGGGDRDGLPPARLLEEMRAIGDRTSAQAHGYWLPLLVFGALVGGSLAFYERLPRPRLVPAGPLVAAPCQAAAGHPCHVAAGAAVHLTVVTALGFYWQLVIPAAVVLIVLWYHWQGQRVGLRTPARAFLITGLVLGELVLLGPLLAGQASSLTGLVHDTHQAGAQVIIAVLLWVLAWAERSRLLAVIAAVYLAAALAVSPFDNSGVAGGTTGAADLSLTALRLLGLLPALILLAAGLGAWLARRLRLRHTALVPG
ncbi:MAG TPA: hypothetical protein VIZ00_09490 [Streptosporangiaceae bacterium]